MSFYFAVAFRHRRKPAFMFLPRNEKPFTIDAIQGTIEPKGIPTMGKEHFFFADEWVCIETGKLSTLHTDESSQEEVNMMLEEWCAKHKRKFEPLVWKVELKGVKP